MAQSVLKLKKQQQPPLINSLLIPLYLLYVDCCKLCSFKDLCKSDNDSHNQMKTGKTVSLSTNLFGYPGFTRSTPQQKGQAPGMPNL